MSATMSESAINCVNLSETAEYMYDNNDRFTPEGQKEIRLLFSAVRQILDTTLVAFDTEHRRQSQL